MPKTAVEGYVEIDRVPNDTCLTVTVRVTRRFRFRLRLAILLVRLAARIYPGRMAIEEEAG